MIFHFAFQFFLLFAIFLAAIKSRASYWLVLPVHQSQRIQDTFKAHKQEDVALDKKVILKANEKMKAI